MSQAKTKQALERRLERLQASLAKEKQRITQVSNNIGWGAGMRCTKVTPSFRREDEIRDKIEEVKRQLAQL